MDHLKIHDVLQNGFQMPDIKEDPPEIDLFDCQDGFSLVIGLNRDVIFVSRNVNRYIRLIKVIWEVVVDQLVGVFASKHSVDMKLVETGSW